MIVTDESTVQQEEIYSPKELVKQFSPNIWNPKKDKFDIIVNHFRLTLEGTEKARQELKCSLDQKYGETTAQKFDVYGTDLSQSALTFVWIHGGGWQLGSKDISGFFATTLRKWGIRTVVIGYTLAPHATVTEMIQEIEGGLKTVMAMYPHSDFIVGGHSAGAHLASSILHTSFVSSQIKKLALFSGVYDLRPYIRTVFNENTKITREEAVRTSSILQQKINATLKAQDVKVLIVVGQLDPPLFKSQAQKYNQHLINVGVSSRCWISEQDDHFSIVENLMDEMSPVTSELKKFLFTERNRDVQSRL